MRRLSALSILVFASLVLSACTAIESPVALSTTSIVLSSTPESTLQETEQLTQELSPIFTVTAEPTKEPTPSFPPDLDCGEQFCQAIWMGILARPIGPSGNQSIDLTYPYASTRNGTLEPHHGVEFPNASGTPVLAAQDGEVIFAGSDELTLLGPYTSFYGNVIILRHPELFEGRDIYTLYAHLSVISADVGQTVTLGEQIGAVGATGAANGSHLHFEVRLDENDYAHTTNPILWIEPLNSSGSGKGSTLTGLLLDAWGEPIDRFTLSLEKLAPDGSVEKHYYPITYYPAGVNANPVLGENFAVPDLPPGNYRISFISGSFYQYYFTLDAGSLGFIKLQVD
jgi:hypothetical protein